MKIGDLEITILRLNWLTRGNEADDRCAHGQVRVKIGGETIVEETDNDGWTLSTTALYLLRTLTQDYEPEKWASQIVPCCGFTMWVLPDTGEAVSVLGCQSGFDWTIKHENGDVVYTSVNGSQARISFEEHKKLVLDFADEVEAFYRNSLPKNLPADKEDLRGYRAFWQEWKSIRTAFCL